MVLQMSNSMSCRPGPTTPLAQEQEAEAEAEFRRGLWTVEEDRLLYDHVIRHGGSTWTAVAHAAGLKRSGNSCRLRWLNYLRPDVKRGNFTAEEQRLILSLHSLLGNRWSKIAERLPGRTGSDIKNYWRTRVQKHGSTGAGDDEGTGDHEGGGDASCASGSTMENSASVVTRDRAGWPDFGSPNESNTETGRQYIKEAPSKSFEMSEMNVSCITETSSTRARQARTPDSDEDDIYEDELELTLGRPK